MTATAQSERIDLLRSRETKERWERAAEIAGAPSIACFVKMAVTEQAEALLREHERLTLRAEGSAWLRDFLRVPVREPTPAPLRAAEMRRALIRHDRAVGDAAFFIEPLAAHDHATFTCGAATVDTWRHERAAQMARRGLAAVHVLVEEATGTVAGYHLPARPTEPPRPGKSSVCLGKEEVLAGGEGVAALCLRYTMAASWSKRLMIRAG